MKIYNETRKSIVARNAAKCTSIVSKTIGLMFAPAPRPLVFVFSKEKKVPLHMWFVRFSIEVMFLDSSYNIVEIKERFKPWAYYTPKNKAQYILELPKGTVKSSKSKIGDKLFFRE